MSRYTKLIQRLRRLRPAGAAPPVETDAVADPDDPAVALALRIMAEEGETGDQAALEAELDAAKRAFDSAPEGDRDAALARLTQATVRAALAREARRKFGG